jgi:hypothetical protein|tara:strand:- start:6584 stop:6757 length:174 start_codon:yes stop_codon:yes gene_type:complete
MVGVTEFNPTAEEVIAELTNHPDGKVQLEMAVLRAVVARQKAYIDASQESEKGEESP